LLLVQGLTRPFRVQANNSTLVTDLEPGKAAGDSTLRVLPRGDILVAVAGTSNLDLWRLAVQSQASGFDTVFGAVRTAVSMGSCTMQACSVIASPSSNTMSSNGSA